MPKESKRYYKELVDRGVDAKGKAVKVERWFEEKSYYHEDTQTTSTAVHRELTDEEVKRLKL